MIVILHSIISLSLSIIGVWLVSPYRYDARIDSLGFQKHTPRGPELGSRASFYPLPPAALTISSATLEDAGLYQCRVDFAQAPSKTTKTQVNGGSRHLLVDSPIHSYKRQRPKTLVAVVSDRKRNFKTHVEKKFINASEDLKRIVVTVSNHTRQKLKTLVMVVYNNRRGFKTFVVVVRNRKSHFKHFFLMSQIARLLSIFKTTKTLRVY